MAFGYPGFVSCTPGGIMRLLDAYGADPAGKHAVVVGRSPILGKPVGMLLLGRNATVTYCHSRTRDLPISSGPPISSSRRWRAQSSSGVTDNPERWSWTPVTTRATSAMSPS